MGSTVPGCLASLRSYPDRLCLLLRNFASSPCVENYSASLPVDFDFTPLRALRALRSVKPKSTGKLAPQFSTHSELAKSLRIRQNRSGSELRSAKQPGTLYSEIFLGDRPWLEIVLCNRPGYDTLYHRFYCVKNEIDASCRFGIKRLRSRSCGSGVRGY